MKVAMHRVNKSSTVLLLIWIVSFAGGSLFAQTGKDNQSKPQRVRQGLAALYDFSESEGSLIRDRAAVGKPLDLRIRGKGFQRIDGGGLRLTGKASLQSTSAANRLDVSIERSGELSLEVWLRADSTNQTGPARIVSLSKDSSNRNVTLGQDGDKIDVRFRTSKTSLNGLPSVASSAGAIKKRLTHVVYTRARNGEARIYVDGKQLANKKVSGGLQDWDPSYKLSIGDEITGGRPWKGTLYLVAIYHRGLQPVEVQQNFLAGHMNSNEGPGKDEGRRADSFFTQKVAPLLAEHCLECHDAANQQGGLDLSHKLAALAGGESGKVIVAGKSDASSLFQLVSSNDMPVDRPSLSKEEKDVLRTWIDQGANWSLDFVDPVLYSHDRSGSRQYVRRLTVEEYIATVKAVFDVSIETEARKLLPPDLRADGFSNTAYNLGVDLKHVESYAALAQLVASRVDIPRFIRRFTNSPKFTDKTMGKLIGDMGRWVLRGEVSEEETIAYRGISTTVASAGGTMEEAVGYLLEAMLQSPRFLYRLENQLGDGTLWPVNEQELAVRIAYIVWGAPPDKELYKAAQDGDLYDSAQLDAQLERLFKDPRARQQAGRFVAEWLNLRGLENLSPNRERFPKWSPVLARDMQQETLRFFEHVAWDQDRPLSDVLNARETFVTPRLAKHYNLQHVLVSASAGEFQRVQLEDSQRGGLLTQGSVLTIGGDEASTVTRGLFVLHDLLRGVVKDPPPCVDTTPVPTKPGLTQRMIATSRIKNEACGGCHAKFEPLAFGLEKFDGLGSYHELDEYKNQLREDGEVLVPGESEAVEYETSRELMDLLASSERVQQSLTWKVVQFAIGRPLTADDAPFVERVHQQAQESGGSYRQIVRALVKSDLVQATMTEASEQ